MCNAFQALDMDCKRCSKTMKNSSSLKRHMYRCMANGKTLKSVDKKVTCPTCNKTLARKYSLDRHIARFHAAVQESIVKSEQLEDLQEIPIVKSEQLGDLQEIPNIVKSDQRGDLQDFRDKDVQTSLRNECKERVFDFMWRGVTCQSIPYGILDVYQIKKRLFQNLHSFFQFKLEEILNSREQLLVGAMLDSNSLEESRAKLKIGLRIDCILFMRIDYYCILSIKFEIQSFICLNKIKQAF